MSKQRKPSMAQKAQTVQMSKMSPDTASLDSEDSHSGEILGLHHDSSDNDNETYLSSKSSRDSDTLPDGNSDAGRVTKSQTLLSKITTVKIDDDKIVPMKERRGLLSQFCLIPEYQDARELPPSLRRTIVFIIAFCAMLGPMGTSILLPASDDAIRDLGTTVTILNVAIGVYLITLGVIPLWWSNFSERHGRRSIYIISFILYLCFTIGCALANNVNTLIGFRILSGGCAASVQSVGAGTIGDLYPITKRGAAMGLFYLGPLAGPLLSPIIGGAITSSKSFGWRATQWFLIILSGVSCLMIIFLLPETLRKQDNREAIRQILRDRLKNRTPKKDEEAGTSNANGNLKESTEAKDPMDTTSNIQSNSSPPTLKVETDVPDTELPLSPTTSIDSNVFDEEDEDVDEEKVEHLNKLLSRMSTHRSVAGVANAKSDIAKSRKSSFASTKSTHRNPSFTGERPKSRKPSASSTHRNERLNRPSFGTEASFDSMGISDASNAFDNKDYGYEDSDTEVPVMDSVVPLSKVPTTGTIRNMDERKKKKKLAMVAAELDNIHNIAHGSKFKLFWHYTKLYLYAPLKGFVFLRYPPVLLAIAYSAPCFAALYVQNMTLTYMYSKAPYNFSPIIVGLMYVPNSVTYLIASIWGGKFNDYLLKKKIEKYGIIAPEARFGINVYVAAALLPLSLLITGWCLEYGEHWVTPLIGTALFGFAQMLVIGVTVTYLADCLPGRGATGIALNNFIRMIMAAGISFVTEPLIKVIGTGVLFSICAGITAALSVLIFIIVRNGDRWRETYDLEKLYDIVDS
jgi:multidrug resistance protein